MTPKAQTLPMEILLDVFKLVPPKTVHQCLFVCKDWTSAAAEEFYKEVSLTGTKMVLLKPTLKLPKDQVPKMIGFGDYIKSIKIHDDKDTVKKLNYTQLTLLSSQFPQLKNVDLSNTNKIMHYLKELSHIARSQQQSNKEATTTISFQEIEVGCLGVHSNNMKKADNYFKTCYTFRSSLTHLQLSSLMQELTTEDGLSGNYVFYHTSKISSVFMYLMILKMVLQNYLLNLCSRRIQS